MIDLYIDLELYIHQIKKKLHHSFQNSTTVFSIDKNKCFLSIKLHIHIRMISLQSQEYCEITLMKLTKHLCGHYFEELP